MAEYTPTTDEVRARFIDGAINRAAAEGVTGFSVTLYITDKARADFDRWLAEVRREAAEKAWREGYLRGYRDRRLEKSFNPHQEEEGSDDD